MARQALIVVDVQNDFCPGGSLAVEGGDEVVPRLNHVISAFTRAGFPVLFTGDWHPPNHCSFKPQGGPWPPHCVRETRGADFHPDLRVPPGSVIIHKGSDPRREAYSGFDGTDLEKQLRSSFVKDLFIGGLATDYCVRQTSLDALKLGFGVTVLEDCVRGVDVHPGDSTAALAELRSRGAIIQSSPGALKRLTTPQ